MSESEEKEMRRVPVTVSESVTFILNLLPTKLPNLIGFIEHVN